MNELEKLIFDAQKKWGNEVVKAIVLKIDTLKIKWLGNLRRSISYDIKEGNVDFKMTDYGQFIDQGVNGLLQQVGSPFSFKGRIAGTAYHIKQWADSKGINEWALATSIQKKGIRPRKFFNSVIEARIPDLGDALLKVQSDYIDRVINRNNPENI
jgi:hypothetical protein